MRHRLITCFVFTLLLSLTACKSQSIVGNWGDGKTVLAQFAADGKMRLRIPMGYIPGTYQSQGENKYKFDIPGPTPNTALTGTVALDGDKLSWTFQSEGPNYSPMSKMDDTLVVGEK
jgi:hypothetical protein